MSSRFCTTVYYDKIKSNRASVKLKYGISIISLPPPNPGIAAIGTKIFYLKCSVDFHYSWKAAILQLFGGNLILAYCAVLPVVPSTTVVQDPNLITTALPSPKKF